MRRFIFHLLVAIITFSIGIIAVRVSIADHLAINTREAQKVEPVTLETPEPSVQPNSTQAATELVFDYDPKEFDPRGGYSIVGRKPKDFREFDSFELAVSDYYGVASGVSRLQTYSEQTYNGYYSMTGLVTKKRLTFVATPFSDEDYVYSFDGRFLKEGVLADPFKARVVLEGKLIKSKGCVKIAECDVKFRVEYLGC
jgi:hypothetical protein